MSSYLVVLKVKYPSLRMQIDTTCWSTLMLLTLPHLMKKKN